MSIWYLGKGACPLFPEHLAYFVGPEAQTWNSLLLSLVPNRLSHHHPGAGLLFGNVQNLNQAKVFL